jgi:CheY-like chemotaxis protein
LVEDNEENVFLVQTFLAKLPVVVDLASDGSEAVKKRKNGYDLILMDVQMPVMDGYTATRLIREWERAENRTPVPIVVLSAHALHGAAEEATAAGCNGYLTKPVEREDLIAAIASYSNKGGGDTSDQPAGIRSQRPKFLQKRRGEIDLLQCALAESDLATIERIAHDCKGIARAYGFPAIGDAAALLEEAARGGDLVRLNEELWRYSAVVASAEVD